MPWHFVFKSILRPNWQNGRRNTFRKEEN